MEENKLTNEEIVKALECCAVEPCEDCGNCPRFTKEKLCHKANAKQSLDLIHRLQGVNERIQEISKEKSKDYYAVAQTCALQEETIAKQKAEIERLSFYKTVFDKGLAVSLVNMQETIDKQKAEIERLTEENAILKGNPPMCVGRSNGKTIRAKLLAFDRMKEQNAELQKQVDELKKRLIDDFEKFKVEAFSKVQKQAVKDTAKEILTDAKKWVKEHYKDKITDSFGEREMLFMEAFGCLLAYLKDKHGVEVE